MIGVLGLAPGHCSKKVQVRQTDQVWYHHRLQVSSLAVDLQWCYCPLRYFKTEVKKQEALHLYRWYTHTHTPCRSRVFFRKTHRENVRTIYGSGAPSVVSVELDAASVWKARASAWSSAKDKRWLSSADRTVRSLASLAVLKMRLRSSVANVAVLNDPAVLVGKEAVSAVLP